jgi:hypothetical protein
MSKLGRCSMACTLVYSLFCATRLARATPAGPTPAGPTPAGPTPAKLDQKEQNRPKMAQYRTQRERGRRLFVWKEPWEQTRMGWGGDSNVPLAKRDQYKDFGHHVGLAQGVTEIRGELHN